MHGNLYFVKRGSARWDQGLGWGTRGCNTPGENGGWPGSPMGLRRVGPHRNQSLVMAHAWQTLSCCEGLEEGSPHQAPPHQTGRCSSSETQALGGMGRTGPQALRLQVGEQRVGAQGTREQQAKQEPQAESQNPGEHNSSPLKQGSPERHKSPAHLREPSGAWEHLPKAVCGPAPRASKGQSH